MATAKRGMLAVVLPKKRGNGKGTSYTNTFDPNAQGGLITAPDYRDHLTDILTSRQGGDSGAVLQNLFKTDPDVSAALSAYLTVADTEPVLVVRDALGVPTPEGHELLQQTLMKLNTRYDYSKGYDHRKPLEQIATEFRHMLLLRGSIGAEAILDKDLTLLSIRNVDMRTIKWYETEPGRYAPYQTPKNDSNNEISLDIPTFFTSNFRTDPTNVYTDSPWVSVINTVAARQQIVNDLYRIMQITGYPRIVISVMEEVMLKNMPASIQLDEPARRAWANERFQEIKRAMSNTQPNQAVVTWDSYDFKMLNEKSPGMEMDITPIIEMLNAQNQAALKVMATVIGRGSQGVNTSTVEARIFAMNADQLNKPVAQILSAIFTLAIRLQGFDGYVEMSFKPAELRPDMELEPQRNMQQARLLNLLSLGIISDLDFHLTMFGRPPPPEAKPLSGTGFMNPVETGVNEGNAGTGGEGDALGRSVSSERKKSTVDNPRKS